VHALSEDKSDDTKDNFYKELQTKYIQRYGEELLKDENRQLIEPVSRRLY
jgi:hypothetical protein